ncbi:hypothetical protein IZ6_25290 [Terrihabitans soli]|uniref:SF3 helicase domain-containing protein n=1 Tax=Terrihabitans soli TaxID=708113 RepID=A0A6S6QMS9_9HYPH|nr:phage/plasmid primase, P4 family [Terrihabitans soli]BCJ91794.1 hypothetical protein IZ6_25290 [Terrihabitans soli]
MNNIFANEAPRYWAAGLPVIPLRVRDKMPAINRWQLFADTMPTEDQKEEWLLVYHNGNIGLPLGPQSNIVAIDIDTDDPKVLAVLERVLPKSPWKRIGRKGCVMAYRYNGQRTFRLKFANGEMLCECLSKGTQFVLPPSIHPTTQLPYQANGHLLDVLSILPLLPRDIESILRGALEDEGIELSSGTQTRVSTFVPSGARDNAMVAHAGILARAITRGERTLIEALDEIGEWVDSFVERVAGDDISREKAQQKVIEFLVRDVLGERKRTLPEGWDTGLSGEDKEKLGLNFEEENERWEAIKIRNYMQAEFQKISEPNSSAWMSTVEFVLARIAAADLSSLEEDQMLQTITNLSNKQITLTALRKRLRELRQGEIEGNDHAEIANAVITEMSHFGEIRFFGSRFWQWRGACWEPLQEGHILRVIAEDFGHYPAAKKQNDHRGIVKTMASLLEKDLKQIALSGVNFANGFLTEDLELHPHNPDHGLTYVLPYRYMPEDAGRCPLFTQYLHDAWGENPDFQDKISSLQEMMAATMFGLAPKFQRVCCLLGPGGTGKTTLAKIMMELLPDDAVSYVPPHDWSDRFQPTMMLNKIMNFCGELSESKLIDGEKFKLIVEGAEINGQLKGQQIFKFRPIAAQWFAANHLPKSRDHSDGFTRRWLFLEFTRVIPREQRDVDFAVRVANEEREAIASWAVQAILRLKENQDYTIPMSHVVRVEEVSNSINSVRYFLTGSNQVRVGIAAHQGSKETRVSEAKLHEKYYSFCLGSAGVQPVGLQTFRQRMRDLKVSLGFDIIMGKETAGPPSVEYEFITIVETKRT